MKLLPSLIIASAALCATFNTYAVVELNKTPLKIGVRPTSNLAYFTVAETLTTPCTANVLIIIMDTAGLGKIAYATVLAAKVTGKQLKYLEYTQDINGYCNVVQLEVAP